MPTSTARAARSVQLRFFVLLVFSVLSAVLFSYLLKGGAPQIASADLILDVYRDHIAPKPVERIIFSALAAAIPVLALLLSMRRRRVAEGINRSGREFLPLAIAGGLFAPFLGSDFTATLLGRYNVEHFSSAPFMLAAGLGGVAWCWWFAVREEGRRVRLQIEWIDAAVWSTFAAAVLLQMLPWRVVGIDSVTRSGVWSTHADPVFFALSQTVGGKTLLADLPSQYGLFPQMLSPLFRLVGLSVGKLTALFAVMQVGSLMALFYVLSRLVKSRALLLVGGLALVLVTFETVLFFIDIDERYFQYWPVRFFWPALSALTFYWFSGHRSLLRSVTMSFVAAVGLLWNMDSGLFIVVAYGAYLVARLVVKPDGAPEETRKSFASWAARDYLLALALHIGVVLVFVAGSLVTMRLRAGEPLNFSALVEYQRVFVELGLMMLPLPRQPHPWMSVLGVYLLGLLYAMGAWRRGMTHLRADVVFYLSMLGLGLFVYYTGRSHVLNLVTVCWPAVLLVTIGADQVLRAVRIDALPRTSLALPLSALTLLLLAAGSFAARVPFLATAAFEQLERRGKVEEPFVASELDLIKRYSTGKKECLILSQRQGIYYAESGLASPLKGPGIVEILLKADQQALVHGFLEGRLDCVFLGIGGFTNPGLGIDTATALKNYDVKGRNNPETMLFLQSKP